MKGFKNLSTLKNTQNTQGFSPLVPEKEGFTGDVPTVPTGEEKKVVSNTNKTAISLSRHERIIPGKKTDSPTGNALKPLPPPPPPAAKYPFHRISPPLKTTLPTEDIVIKGSPNFEKAQKMNWLSTLASPMGMIVIMLVMVLITGAAALTSFIYMIPMSLIGVLVAVINYRSQKKAVAKSTAEMTEKYLSYLSEIEEKITGIAQKQRDALNAANPSADACVAMNADSTCLWNRGSSSKDFMSVRLGVGEAPLCVKIKAPEKSYDRDIPLEDTARAIAENYRMVSDIPVSFDLRTTPSVGIVGERKDVVNQAISLIVNATAVHSYEDLKLIVVYPKEEQSLWADARWLPHVYSSKRDTRYISGTTSDSKILLGELAKTIEKRADTTFRSPWETAKASPHYLVIIADMSCIKGSPISHFLTLNNPALAVSTVFLAPDISLLPQNCQGIIETEGSHAQVYLASASDKKTKYTPDYLRSEKFSQYCHTMAPIRIDGTKGAKEIPSFFTFLDAWKVKSPEELPIADCWYKSLPSNSMQVPLGAAAEGTVFCFDDHQNAHGVHGMYVGTNGSGKSSMIRSWILSMAVQFSPKYVNFVLVDFKGSGLLDGLEKLPHVVGTISNLDSDIRRNLTALESEIERREAFFKETGGNIYSCYKNGITNMPFLYIIIDELNEFKLWSNTGDDNRMKLLDRLAQVGRALGMQLIAGSQTSAPFTDTMEKNFRFRWCLKTATTEDSMYLLKTDDAFNITEKGRAIVRVGSNEVYEEIQPAFADGPYYTPEELHKMPEREMALLNLQGAQAKVAVEDSAGKFTQLDAVVAHINKTAADLRIRQPRKIWPDRLPLLISLQNLSVPKSGELKAAIGLVDDPKGQWQYTLQIDLEKNGHVVLYGAPRTGKTTFLMTAALSLLTHCNSDQLEIYMIGSSFKPLWDCPQVQKGTDTFSPKPVVAAVYNELIRRKKRGLSSEDRPIVFFIDGIGELMFEFKSELTNLAQFGSGCRIYLFASAGKQADTTPIASYLTRGYALWFADSLYDYRAVLSEKNVDRIPSKEIPGRGIFYDGRTMEFQTAMPFKSGEELSAVVEKIVKENKRSPRPIKPTRRAEADVVIGIGTGSGCEVIHNFREQSSLLILGTRSQKRDALLRSVAEQIAKQPDVFQIVGVDLDRDQYASVPKMTVLSSGENLDTFLAGMVDELKRRNDLLKEGKHTQFPKYIFLIDDWENCVRSITELSHKRLAINVLQKGKLLGIQLVTACSYEDYGNRFDNDEIGATQLLGVGCAVFLGYSGQRVPACFTNQVKSVDTGDFYVTTSSAECIDLSIVG